jgi:hypothetical protein
LSGSSKENSLVDIINLYMRELKMHPKELSLKDGELQTEVVQVKDHIEPHVWFW